LQNFKIIMKKIFVFALLAMVTFSCGEKKDGAAPTPPASTVDGEKVFKTSCAVCHGVDGKLGANGSKDLTISTLPVEDRIALITNGKGVMPAQGSILTADEIKAVAEYTLTLKK
jgi:mono/diheme cytochrome c family protein